MKGEKTIVGNPEIFKYTKGSRKRVMLKTIWNLGEKKPNITHSEGNDKTL